ncbi:MAG: LPS export ABC transporter periplasmic protein LptC [Candidatus Omnitrophota bacterium]
MRKKVLWIIFVVVAAVAVWSWWGYWTAKTGPAKEQPTDRPEGANGLVQKVFSFSIDGRSAKGVKQWHLEGNSADIIGDDIHLNDLKAVAYGENEVVDLTSDMGVYRKEAGEVELIGNVEVAADDGFNLTTDRAKWSQLTREISTDKVVHIKREGMTAVGKGGMANSEEKWARLNEDVMVIMEPHTKVNCDGPLEVDYKNNKAIFYKNVKVEDKDGKLFADKLTVNFDPETQKLAQVVAEGNVKVKRGKTYTISEKAIYTDSTKSAQLLGKPRIIIDPEELDKLEGTGIPSLQERE